jgi:type IV secretory pathway TrbD component
MRIAVQKAITNPLRILGAPYGLALLNFVVFFSVFLVFLAIYGGNMNPLYFIAPFMLAHYILARVSKSEPQLGRIISSKIKLIGLKIPKNLVA